MSFQSHLAELSYLRFSILVLILTSEYFLMSSEPILGFSALSCATLRLSAKGSDGETSGARPLVDSDLYCREWFSHRDDRSSSGVVPAGAADYGDVGVFKDEGKGGSIVLHFYLNLTACLG